MNPNIASGFVFSSSTSPFLSTFIVLYLPSIAIPIITWGATPSFSLKKANIPAFPVNGNKSTVLDGTTSLQLIISDNNLKTLDITKVYIIRSGRFFVFDSADITAGTGNKSLTIEGEFSGGTTVFPTIDSDDNGGNEITGGPFIYQPGDEFFVRVKGTDLGSGGIFDDNAVEIARDILKTYGGAVAGDFDANWDTFRAKSSPAQSNIAGFKLRHWQGEAESALKVALSLLNQVRLQAAPDKELTLKITSLHFEDFTKIVNYTMRNWDIEEGTFNPHTDDRNQWNRAKADFDFDPALNENGKNTSIFRNSAAITQATKEISKTVVFPDMYIESQVILQLKEMIKLASAYSEFIFVTVSQRVYMIDVGDFKLVDVKIAATIIELVPCMVRRKIYRPDGRVDLVLWSFQMTPFPTFNPGFNGTVGGFNATITEE